MSCQKLDLWMPLYWGDYLRHTGHLGATEHGAYLLLIGHYWSTGAPLPDDNLLLRRITRTTARQWQQIRGIVLAFFQRDGERWRHKRIDQELERWKQVQAQKAVAGHASASARKKPAPDERYPDTSMEPSYGLQMETSHAQKSEQNQQKSSTAVPTTQHLKKERKIDDDERTPLHCAQDAVMDELDVRNDPTWLGDAGMVECWLNAGADLERDILPTIRQLMARRGPRGRPYSLKYFSRSIADALATRTQKLSPGTSQPQEHRYGRMGPATGIAAGFAAALAEREARRRANQPVAESLLDSFGGPRLAPLAGR